jgi:exoribonuclease-2
MVARGFLPDFSPQALAELDGISGPAIRTEESTRDLRRLAWCSIDNDDSRDLDQLTVAEAMPGGAARILVAIADVDALVKKQSAIDDHARQNTTSVYTVAETFPMLPDKLSTDLTSLNYESDRLAIVIEMVLAGDGSLQSSDLYGATVRNRAKLAYNSVAAWIEGNGLMPQGIGTVKGLDENLRLQDRVAQKLKVLRHLHGALDLETIEARPVFDGDKLKDLEADTRNCSRAFESGSLGNVEPRSVASSMIRSQRLGMRTTRRSDVNFLDARYRAVTPLAAIMKSSIISLALFFFSASRSLSSSPSKTGRASIVSRSSAPCRCRSDFSFWATLS